MDALLSTTSLVQPFWRTAYRSSVLALSRYAGFVSYPRLPP